MKITIRLQFPPEMSVLLLLVRSLKICYFRKGLKEQKRMVKMLNDMFESTAYFDTEELTAVLLVSLSEC